MLAVFVSLNILFVYKMVYVCMYVCVYIYIYICMYVFIFAHKKFLLRRKPYLALYQIDLLKYFDINLYIHKSTFM